MANFNELDGECMLASLLRMPFKSANCNLCFLVCALAVELDMALPFALDELPAPDHWMATGSQTMARKQDITLIDSELGGTSSLTSSSMQGFQHRRKASSAASSLVHNHGDGEEDNGSEVDEEDWAQTEFDPGMK